MPEPASPSTRWTESRRLAVLLACVALVYLPVFFNGLVYDDTMLIVGSRIIHDVRNLPAVFMHPAMFASAQYSGGASQVDTYRPVTIATFMWDAALSGVAPWAYHLTNLLAHLICVWLVYRVARAALTEADRGMAWIGAGWFALSPLAAEAHVWINGRSDVFATLFGLTAVLAWRRALESPGLVRWSWQLTAAISFLAGLLSKEVLLLCIPAMLFWPEPSRTGVGRRLLHTTPFAAAGLVYLALRSLALGGMRSFENAAQLERALWQLPWLLVDAAVQSLLPTRPYLRLLYEEYARLPGSVFPAAGAVLVLIATLALVYRRVAPAAWWGLLWFALPLIPVSIISTMYWPGFGRYLYLPGAGMAVTISTVAARLWRARPRLHRVLIVALVAYAAILVAVLEGVIASYRDSAMLYTRTIQFRPELAYGYGMLAASMSTQLHDLDKVARLLELAERLDPSVPRYPIHLVQTRLVLKQPQLAATAAERALERFPSEPTLHYLAAVARMAEDPEPTVQHLSRCLEIQPAFPRCRSAVELLCAEPSQCERFRASLKRAAGQTEHAAVRSLLLRTSETGL